MPVVQPQGVLAVTSDSDNGWIIRGHLSRVRRAECISATVSAGNMNIVMTVPFLRSARYVSTFPGRMNRKAMWFGVGAFHSAAFVTDDGILT